MVPTVTSPFKSVCKMSLGKGLGTEGKQVLSSLNPHIRKSTLSEYIVQWFPIQQASHVSFNVISL